MGAMRNTVIACISNLSTAYNLVVISIVHIIVQNQYCGGNHCSHEVSIASTSCLVGAIVGQLTFGYVGDCLGRSRALQLTMALSIIGALASAFAVPLSPSRPETIFYFLSITRFFLGVGVGGVYPLSATIASESAGSSSSRGRTASIVFSMQGIGNLTVPLATLLLVQVCGNPPSSDPSDLGLSWRLALGLGALPGILLAPFKASETSRRAGGGDSATNAAIGGDPLDDPLDESVNGSLKGVARSIDQGGGEAVPLGLLDVLKMRRYWGKLLGCAGGWFLFDITFYGNSLFQAEVLTHIFNATHSDGPTPIEGGIDNNHAIQMLVIAAMGLPGYYVSVYLMDSFGRRNIQLQGFFFMALTFGILGVFLKQLEGLSGLMLLLYGLTFFFSNFGPNSTTFILPAETFPPHLRTTLNGFSAACGKAGATLGSATFKLLVADKSFGLGKTLILCAAVSLLGLLLTFGFVEDRRGKGMEGEGAPPPLATLDQQRQVQP
jgi:PHS family inorganic phosphate transporter-like MFS transporter